MSLILAWVLFPLVLAVIGAGWGAAVEWAAGTRVNDALLLPLGLAAALVLAGTLTAFAATAPAAVPVVAVGAVAGLVLAFRERRRVGRWPLLAAVGVLLVYGAPVLLSGQATFTGFVKLDDTATWLNVVDHVMSHGPPPVSEVPSTYMLVYNGDVGATYPLGSFMLLGVGHALTGIDSAWVFQPYLACCGAALALCLVALMEPIVASVRIRALVALLAAQPALLYGYGLWGGIKEVTAAFLLALGVALVAAIFPRRPAHPRELLPLAVAAGALIVTLGVGAAGWVAPALALVAAAWLAAAWTSGRRRARELLASVTSLAWLGGLTAACAVPVWIVLEQFLAKDAVLFSSGTTDRIGNLIHPLSAFQLAGIWPVGDFRVTAPTLASALLIGLVLIAAVAALWVSARGRQFGLALYVTVALTGSGVVYLSGATPWVTGKVLAISSPALLAAALTGAAMLWSRHRVGILVLVALAGGVLWSNALAYHDATIAPRPRLAELAYIGDLVAGKGPTFINDYEDYADRHFLRDGAPVEPAEYRPVTLPLRNGVALTKSAWADLDSFPLSTLEPYRSIVTRRSPAESRPPSIYSLVWEGRYYQLWQRPALASTHIIEHVPFGESNTRPYCGAAEGGATAPLCSIDPVAIPPCPQIQRLARRALGEHAQLVAYQRPVPIIIRGDETVWPVKWAHESSYRALIPTSPGAVLAHIALDSSQIYELSLDGSFARGFDVSVDGRHVGRVKNQLADFSGYIHIADVFLASGIHTIVLSYPHADLTPGSGLGEFDSLSAIALAPQQRPASELISVAPQQAAQLCGRPLDWIELAVSA